MSDQNDSVKDRRMSFVVYEINDVKISIDNLKNELKGMLYLVDPIEYKNLQSIGTPLMVKIRDYAVSNLPSNHPGGGTVDFDDLKATVAYFDFRAPQYILIEEFEIIRKTPTGNIKYLFDGNGNSYRTEVVS